MSQRLLVMGDNHGDTESLRRVLDDTAGESFDAAVHVGDFTRAMRRDRAVGAEQLRDVEPHLAELDDRAAHGLLWVYGNQDYFGDLEYDLDVGTEIPDDDTVTVGGQRFTNSLDHVDDDVVLVTHMERWRLADSFDGRAHFCGNTHLGRRHGRRLNAAFLQATERGEAGKRFGGYFVVDLRADGFDVEMRSIGDLRRVECDDHRERGVQFLPADQPCMFCWQDEVLMRELAASSFYGVTHDDDRETASAAELIEYALDLWDDPPMGFRSDFAAYLSAVGEDRYAPLARTDDGRLSVAEESYAY